MFSCEDDSNHHCYYWGIGLSVGLLPEDNALIIFEVNEIEL